MNLLWFYGFRIFVGVKHPASLILKKLRALPYGRPEAAPAPGVSKPVPKKIWMYWAQGWGSAPALVTICRDSWIAGNPGWEVILLDTGNLSRYLTLGYPLAAKEVSHAAYSDIVRVELLAKYGGVWADATTFCSAPLDSWLPARMQSGFFAFDKRKTTLASWFLAAEKDSSLVRSWSAYVARYWRYADKPVRYFWLHYLFEYLLLLDADARRLWAATPRLSSEGPYALQRCVKSGGDVCSCKSLMDNKAVFVHKLDWRMDTPDALLSMLASRVDVLS